MHSMRWWRTSPRRPRLERRDGGGEQEPIVSVEFRCADVGVQCSNVARADTAEELVVAVAAHAKTQHGVELNATLVDYAITKVGPADG
jgi:predicted small metal-binding protein